MSCPTCNSGDGSCGCVSNLKVLRLGSHLCYSLGGTGDAPNVQVIGNEKGYPISPTILQQQAIVTMSESSNGAKGNIGFQVTADGITWDSPVYFGTPSYQIGNGVLVYDWYTSAYNYKRAIRYVVQMQQNAVNYMAMAKVDVDVNIIIR